MASLHQYCQVQADLFRDSLKALDDLGAGDIAERALTAILARKAVDAEVEG